MLTLAVQKSGRLSENTLKLIKECGISIPNGLGHKLKAKAGNFPLQILFLRDDDIPECLADGAADVGIVGENEYNESGHKLRLIKRLGFAKCRLSLAVPQNAPYQQPEDLNGTSIATSYPQILKTYLKEKGIRASIHKISGSVEITPSIGLADAIFDIVSSGSTLASNGLREIYTVMESEAVLLAANNLSPQKEKILSEFIFRIKALLKASAYKYILLNAPKDRIETICQILPGMKSPTVMPLAGSGWSSVHSVIHEDEFWQRIDMLKKAGAQGILVLPIEKMIL